MDNTPFNEELLMAYADGELDSATCAEVEAYLRGNAEARIVVERFRETAELVRGAFNAPIMEPAPDHLVGFIRNEARRGKPRFNWRSVFDFVRAPGFAWGVAATSLALVVGMGSGLYVAGWNDRLETQKLLMASQQTEQIIRQTIQNTLETQMSGTTVNWRDGENDLMGAVTPIRTFRNTEKKFCREFEVQIKSNSGKRSSKGIACREKDGSWVMRIHILDGDHNFMNGGIDL